MERGVYFDAWFPRQHCYHPSLPPRRLRMIDDLEAYHATSLVWSALGGGSISLPYLEEEAWGEIDPRYRFYGFVNDAEFIEHCQAKGIKVFGIVFEVQGWEFPVELNEAGDQVLSMNETRGVGTPGWLGLREFTQNTHPKLWKTLEEYFPDGLVNSDGEIVTDILEECTSRDIYGVACHSTWVEVPGNAHYSYLMDRNNPVWREYLKAIIRIQIDAGVAGVELDEADLPIFSTGYGGCFCKDCMKLFRAWLQALPPEDLPAELEGTDLATFHYGTWLLERGYDFKADRETTPLYWHYLRFQRQTIVGYFAELSDYIKEYGRSKGRDVLVSGNFYYFAPHYYPFEPKVDILITEMDSTSYRQPSWCRYAAGFAGDKPVIVVENPYGGVPPELLPMLKDGKAYDRFRMMMYEAAALGINMSVPYGAWMGSVIEDSFWAPHDLIVEVQDFIAGQEHLYTTTTWSETAVVYGVQSAFDHTEANGSKSRFPFWHACDALVAQHQPFDVVMFPEGTIRADVITGETLSRYDRLILPEVTSLTSAQADALRAYLDGGGTAVIVGGFAENLAPADRDGLAGHAGVTRADEPVAAALPGGPQVVTEGAPDMAVNVQRLADGGAAVHVIRYDYDETSDEVPVLPTMRLDVRLPGTFTSVEMVCPTGDVPVRHTVLDGGVHRLELEDVPLYVVAVLRG